MLKNLATEALIAATIAAYFEYKSRQDKSYQIESAIRDVNENKESLIKDICNRQYTYELHLRWTVESLNNFINDIEGINIEKVAELIKQGLSTDSIFETPLKRAAANLGMRTSGVMACYNQIVGNPQIHSVEVISLMGAIRKNVKAVNRCIFVLQHAILRWFIFSLQPIHLILASVSIFLFIYIINSFISQELVTTDTLRNQILIDAEQFEAIWLQRSSSLFHKITATSNLIYQIASAIPLILFVSSFPLYIIRKFLIKSNNAREKIENIQNHLGSIAKKLGNNHITLEITMPGNNTNINISGGSFISTQIGTSKSTLNSYIETLQLESYNSSEEQELKEALASLRRAIESDKNLSDIKRQEAASDLEKFSQEITKQPSEQNNEAKKFYWGRLTEILKLSASLFTLAAAVAKFTGMA
ncbi:hypothetical protein BJL95_21125 [Methylomonas sp. LWB]|nr:hypothetical protein BJL95_21125 [Methylomonas sp. LWB]